MTLYQVNVPQGDVDGKHVMHSTAQYATHPDCPDCESIAEFEANPPQHGPAPKVYTEADMADGADALVEALRREFTAYHVGRLAYSDGFIDATYLAIATRTIGGRGRECALKGDAVLVRTRFDDGDEAIVPVTGRPLTESALRDTVSAWCPRARMMCLVRPEWLRPVVIVEDIPIGSKRWEAEFSAKRREMYGEEV